MDQPIPGGKCPMCEQPVPLAAHFCAECGFALTPGASHEAPVRLRWYHNFWVILILLFFVLGPFGLPMVWKHPKMSQTVKWVLTAAVLAYTLVMIGLLVKLAAAVMSSLESFNTSLQPF